MSKRSGWIIALMMIGVIILSAAALNPAVIRFSPDLQTGGSNPPSRVVKLIFIHHSTGENWLSDGYGNLGETLGENNYYVSDTNYGWGPDSIGDRTDIPDWEEWFSGEHSDTYMEALFTEEEQRADYTRDLPDPGGENEIILFKSCFPNSDLEGNSDDPPSLDDWLSVGHAKYVYNEILQYFQKHPEKLFIVITAPPLSDRGNADNARAFNQWLVFDWLRENDYPYNNVAVFDFYNILTGAAGHHTFENGNEFHQTANRDTLYYPSGDDHPSKKGSQKATDEFIPLLNYFYNRWQQDTPAPLSAVTEEDSGAASSQVDNPGPPAELADLIDNYEGGMPTGTNGWEAYWDEGTPSSLRCGAEAGAGLSGNGLRVDYQISPYSWGTCGLFYEQAQDWSTFQGLIFSVHASQGGQVLHVDLYAEGPEGQESYLFELDLTSFMEAGWTQVDIPWESFRRVEWEANAGTPFSKSEQVSGLAFGFSTEEEDLEGIVWVDELGLIKDGEEPVVESAALEEPMNSRSDEDQGSRSLPCIGSMALPMAFAGIALFRRKKTSRYRY